MGVLTSVIDDFVEDVLMDGGLGKATTGLTAARGIDDLVGQPHEQEPVIGHVEVHFLNQTALAANTKEIADEEHLEEKNRVDSSSEPCRE